MEMKLSDKWTTLKTSVVYVPIQKRFYVDITIILALNLRQTNKFFINVP